MAAAGPRAMARSDDVLSGIHARRRCGRTDATAAGSSRSRKPRCGWPRPRWRTATPPCPSSVANSDHPRDALPVRRAAGPVARARREGPRPLNRSALDRDAARKCPKRPFTTHADRLRSRLKGGRLPVAGPVARRAAGRGRRRRPRLRRLFASGVRDGARQLPARAPDGRRDRRLEARPPRPQPHPPGQHRAGPVDPRRGPTGAHRTRCADRHHHRCRPRRWPSSSGADPRTHPGRTHGRAVAGVSTGNVTKVKQLLSTVIQETRARLLWGEVSIHRAWQWRTLTAKAQRDALWEHLHRGAIKTTIARLVRAHVDARAPVRPADVAATVIGGLARLDADDITVAVVDVPGRAVVVTRACYDELREKHTR